MGDDPNSRRNMRSSLVLVERFPPRHTRWHTLASQDPLPASATRHTSGDDLRRLRSTARERSRVRTAPTPSKNGIMAVVSGPGYCSPWLLPVNQLARWPRTVAFPGWRRGVSRRVAGSSFCPPVTGSPLVESPRIVLVGSMPPSALVQPTGVAPAWRIGSRRAGDPGPRPSDRLCRFGEGTLIREKL